MCKYSDFFQNMTFCQIVLLINYAEMFSKIQNQRYGIKTF
jgi:hypothetical protein